MWWPFRRRRHDDKIETLIKPPKVRFTGTDEALRERTATRRRAADGIRERAARVDSGASVSDILRRVK